MNMLKIIGLISAQVLILCSSAHAQGVIQEGQTSEAKKVSPITIKIEQAVVAINSSIHLSAAGDKAAQDGSWELAVSFYQKAVSLWSGNLAANYGLAKCYHQAGDTDKEIAAYQAAIYADDTSASIFRENHPLPLFQFVLLLCQNGRTSEAIPVYNHAASLMKYVHGQPSSGYLLPLFGKEQGEIPPTKARLQALAHVGIGIDPLETQTTKGGGRLAHLREAARLYPDSPVVYAYLSKQLEDMHDVAGAKAALDRANALGLSRVSNLLDAQTAIMQEEKKGVK